MNVDFLFSDALRRAIQASGKKQKDIAEEAGIALAVLANYLNGSREPQVSVAMSLASACGVSVGFLFGESNESTNVEYKTIPPIKTKVKQDAVTHSTVGAIPDIGRACRLLACTPEELAQSIGAPRKHGPTWEAGEARPSYDQLVMLYHQVLAIAVHCCEAERRPAATADARQAVARTEGNVIYLELV